MIFLTVMVDQSSQVSTFMDSHLDLAETISDNPNATEVGAHAGVVLVAGVQARAGQFVINTIFKGYENDLEDRKKKIQLVENKVRFAIVELGEIKHSIEKVVNEIDSLMFKTSKAVDMGDVDFLMKDIKQKLEMFMKKIDDLDEEAVKCSDETL